MLNTFLIWISETTHHMTRTHPPLKMVEACYHGKQYYFISQGNRPVEKYICPICQEILFEPVQTSCGHLFCSECLRKNNSETCPFCRNKIEEEPRRDRFNEREIKNLLVKCQNSSKGCTWEGELGLAEHHLQECCDYELVQCLNQCGLDVARKEMEKHSQDECELRQCHCPYCPWYSDTYKKVTSEHFAECSSYPLNCPNNCGEQGIKRGNLPSHLAVCPEEAVPCRYGSLGCSVKLARKQMEFHLKDSRSHLEIAMTTTSELVLEQHKLREEYTELKQTFNKLTQQLKLSHIASIDTPHSAASGSKVWLKEDLPPCYPPCTLKVVVDANGSGRSPPFIAQSGGYKLILLTYEDDIYSVEVLDEECNYPLKYPVVFVVSYTLLNQDEDRDHFKSIVEMEVECPQKNKGAIYLNCFNSDKRYYKNNTLYIQVDSIDVRC